MKYRLFASLIITFCLLGLTLDINAQSASASDCNYYASPNGSGDGLSQSSPFQIADFWSVAKPGDTLCLLDGVYRGDDSMIDPPTDLNGTDGHPITVKALNDGGVDIDGEDVRRPIYLSYNNWFVIEGVDAHSSNSTVVEVDRSSHDIIRRVTAWDAADGNYSIFGAHHGDYHLFEDCAGWGVARKTFGNSQEGNHVTFRRCWGQWQYNTHTGPKMVITLAYNSYDGLAENCIGTWNATDPNNPYLGNTYGIFAVDGYYDGWDQNANAKYLGCIAYLTSQQLCYQDPPGLFFPHGVSSFELNNCVSYVEGYSTRPYYLRGDCENSYARNITSIGGDDPYLGSSWEVENHLQGSSVADAYSYDPSENIFNATKGARVCFRYVDGVLTDEPLWPWPMNQRIIDAMTKSGYEPVDVTATIEDIFGPIPDECKEGTHTSTCSSQNGHICSSNQTCPGTWLSASDTDMCCSTSCVNALLGDLNMDGVVDFLDVRLCVNVILGLESDPEVIERADTNLDETVNTLDLQQIIDAALETD
jgi:hypothetical protein